MFLVASVEFNTAINPAFIDENKVLAAVLSRALGSGNSYATDLTMLLGKRHGRAAWVKLKIRVNGTAKAVFARVQTLELKLKTVYDGSTKGFQAIQNHNSSFLKTVQDLSNAGSAISDDRQIRDYLVTIQDPILLPLKYSIRADGAQLTLDEVQQKFVDIVEGRKADVLSQSTRHRQVKSVTRPPPNKNKKGKKKGMAAKTRAAAQGGTATIEPKKRKASERLSNKEIALLKVSNPEDWFLTTKTIRKCLWMSASS
jgi:hypothetical protein